MNNRQVIEIQQVSGKGVLEFVRSYSASLHLSAIAWRLLRSLAHVLPAWGALPVVGPDGQTFYLDLRDDGGATQVFDGWNSMLFERVMKRLPADSVALDIGAHIGVFARTMAANFPKGSVYAFEPSPATFIQLARNTRLTLNIQSRQLALSDQEGWVHFKEERQSKLRYISAKPTAGTVTVPCCTLSSWIQQEGLHRLDFIKIDVEGFEEEVLLPAENVLRRFRPVVCFEYSQAMAAERSKHQGEALFPFWQRLGYSVYRFDKQGIWYANHAAAQDWTNDYLATPISWSHGLSI